MELDLLRQKTVAIPGLGGVGGVHLATLCRMGVGGFHIADGDTFSLSNLNRQYGAALSTLGESKTEVMARVAREINPDIRVRAWRCPIDEKNIVEFLSGCDLVIDSLDAFALEARRVTHQTARKMGIPVIAAGPLGFSASMLVFLPGGMGFDEYFNYDEKRSKADNMVDFLVGTAPRPYFLSYMDTSRVHSGKQCGPSSAASVQLCAGFAAAEAVKILLGKGKILAAPYYHYFDSYLMKYKVGYTPLGGRNPLRRLMFYIARRKVDLG